MSRSITEMLDAYAKDEVTFEALKAFVQEYKFDLPASSRDYGRLTWDYDTETETFDNTVFKAMWNKKITRAEMLELRNAARGTTK